nr:hypothetical protein [Desulfobacula sp.]
SNPAFLIMWASISIQWITIIPLAAAGIQYKSTLCYRGIDEKGEMENYFTIHEDIKNLARKLEPFLLQLT